MTRATTNGIGSESHSSHEEFRVRKLSVSSQLGPGENFARISCDSAGCKSRPGIILDDERVPVEYSCAQLIDSSLLSETSITVDYEAIIPASADLKGNVRELHWRLLLSAVEQSGLEKCDLDNQHKGEDRRVTRFLESIPYPTTLYAIRSDLENSALPDVECESEFLSDTEQCVPIRTVLNLKFAGLPNDADVVEDYVSSLLEEALVDRSDELRVKNVQSLEYVGLFDLAPSTGSNQAIGPEPSSDSVVRIGVMVSVASAFMLLVTLLVFRRNGREENEILETVDPKHPEEIADIETGTSHSSSDVVKTNSEDSLGVPSLAPSSSLESPPSLNSASSDETVEADTEESNYPGLFVIPQAYSYDSIEKNKQDGKSVLPKDALPPRPPRRRDSVKLKKTRRRKKKKRATLHRTNSRENVDTMEAIRESDDEESEIESETGSEYSTTDDEGGSNPSSHGSLTPARSKSSMDGSQTSSRPSSPRLSSQDELFPSDVFSTDFNFVIEAPDFPFKKSKRVGEKPTPQEEENKSVEAEDSKRPDLQRVPSETMAEF